MQILIPVIIVSIIGLIVGLGLALAARFMAVPTDEREEKIRECLPGANCGACGYSGCDGYATAIANGEAAPDLCAPGGAATAAGLAEILGVEISAEEKIAFIACGGTPENTVLKYSYQGAQSCKAASLVHGGPLQCEFGCIGFGDCASACPFDAITVENGRPIVCRDICTGCGKCVAACPKSLIRLVPKAKKVFVSCSSTARGAGVAKSCKVSCVGCGLCAKECPENAIAIENNLAVIDREKCTDCGKCAAACRRGAIV